MTENNSGQAEAQAQYEQLAHEMQERERSGSLLPYEKSTMLEQLKLVADKAWPSETPSASAAATPTPSTDPAVPQPERAGQEKLMQMQQLKPVTLQAGSAISVVGMPSTATQPVPVVRPLTPQQIQRLLGVSPWQIEHGSALRSWKVPR